MWSMWVGGSVFALGVLTLGGFASNWCERMDDVKKMVIGAIWIVVIDVTIRYVIRFNVLGYFRIMASLALLAGAGELLRQPDHFYRPNGYAVWMALVTLFLWPLFAWRRGTTSAPAAS